MPRGSLAGIRRAAAAAIVAALALSCRDSVAPDGTFQPEFVTVKRAWLPGERDSVIALIVAERRWVFPYVGDISDQAEVVYADLDSVVVVIPNPALNPRSSGGLEALATATRFAATWSITGVDLRLIDTTQVPADTTDWLGVLWYNPAEPMWKGLIVMDRCYTLTSNAYTQCRATRSTIGPGGNAITINTAIFDNSFGKTGAGGAELRPLTGEYWEADGTQGKIKITGASYGAATTVTSGPWTGGISASGTMKGQLEDVRMTRRQPTANGTFITVSLAFEGTPIQSLRLTCLFDSPCTGQP